MTPTLKEVKVTVDSEGLHVVPIWNDVDRPDSYGWSMNATPKNKSLATRLVNAIKAGRVMTNPIVCKDKDGKTFVSSGMTVLGRHMNADLKRLGF
jgi:hypothetical protein